MGINPPSKVLTHVCLFYLGVTTPDFGKIHSSSAFKAAALLTLTPHQKLFGSEYPAENICTSTLIRLDGPLSSSDTVPVQLASPATKSWSPTQLLAGVLVSQAHQLTLPPSPPSASLPLTQSTLLLPTSSCLGYTTQGQRRQESNGT